MLNLNLEKSFSYNNQIWHCKFPTPNVERAIDAEVARRFNGMPVESVPFDTRQYTKACVTLNFVITKKPQEYEDLKDFEVLFNEEEFVYGLFNQYWEALQSFKNELEEKKRSRQPNNIGSPNSIHGSQIQNPSIQSGNNGGSSSGTSGLSDENGSDVGGFPTSIPTPPKQGKAGKVTQVSTS